MLCFFVGLCKSRRWIRFSLISRVLFYHAVAVKCDEFCSSSPEWTLVLPVVSICHFSGLSMGIKTCLMSSVLPIAFALTMTSNTRWRVNRLTIAVWLLWTCSYQGTDVYDESAVRTPQCMWNLKMEYTIRLGYYRGSSCIDLHRSA